MKSFKAAGAAGELNAVQQILLAPTRPVEELYDLKNDPYELHNLADDPAHRSQLKRMRKALQRWEQRSGDQGVDPEPTKMFDSDMKVYVDTLEARRRPIEHINTIKNNIELMRAGHGKESNVAMRAAVFNEPGLPLELTDREVSTPQAGELFIRLKAAALNRRDYWITQGMYPGLKSDVIQGSDGAGIVEAVGSTEDADWLGEEVIINPGLNWGERSGGPIDGLSYSRDATGWHLCASDQRAGRECVSEAEPFGLAGGISTTLSRRYGISSCDPRAGYSATTVLITGIGGGVATMALKFCVALGAKVLVTSSSPEKIEKAVELGATAGFLYSESGLERERSIVGGNTGLFKTFWMEQEAPGISALAPAAAPCGRWQLEAANCLE